jgi:hypothetical protein
MLVKKSCIAGDLKVFKVFIDGYDVSSAMSSVEIYLDMLMPNWSCKVYMSDTNNLIMTVPIQQGSKISITVETDVSSIMDGKKTFTFTLFKISDKQFKNYAHQTYVLHGVPETWIKNNGARVMQSYTSMSPVMISSSIMSTYLGGTISDIHPANNVVSLNSSNLSPFTAIAQMSKVAMIGNRADFLFFQTDNNKYAMKSLGMIYASEISGFSFKMRPAKIRDSKGNIREDYCQCFTDYYLDHYDSGSAKGGGLYASTAASYDLINQNWNNKEFKFGDDSSGAGGGIMGALKKVWGAAGGSSDLFEQKDANITFNPSHPGMSDKGNTSVDYAKEWSPSRKSSLLKLEQDNLIIQVPVGVRGWTGLGKTCLVELPSQQDVKSVKLDEQFSGLYVITAMCFNLSRHMAFTNYHLAKMEIKNMFGSFSFK